MFIAFSFVTTAAVGGGHPLQLQILEQIDPAI